MIAMGEAIVRLCKRFLDLLLGGPARTRTLLVVSDAITEKSVPQTTADDHSVDHRASVRGASRHQVADSRRRNGFPAHLQ